MYSHSGSVGTGPGTCPRGVNETMQQSNTPLSPGIIDGRFSGVGDSTLSLIVLSDISISQVADMERDSHEETVLKHIQSHVCMSSV